jgi:glycosyltransferase involved in cell wall biosynthesis
MTSLNNINPSISVVMPVFNGEKYIDEAVRSILNQTFTDFEFILIDDCSTDRTSEIVKKFNDPRISYFRNSNNRGNYPCRNEGHELARGKYICVMDADDIAEPGRFRIQYQLMENNSEIGICGSYIKNIPSGIIPRFITDCEILRVAFLFNNYCSHPSIIMRNEFLKKFNLKYNEEFQYSADFELCARGLRYFKVCNITDVLIQYRRHQGQISWEKAKEQEKYADIIRINQLRDILEFIPEEIPVLLHLKLMKKHPILIKYKDKAEQWVKEILERNKIIGYFNHDILQQFLYNSIISCLNNNQNNIPFRQQII